MTDLHATLRGVEKLPFASCFRPIMRRDATEDRLTVQRWIVTCTVGELLGFACAGTIAYFVFTGIPDPTSIGMALGLLLGCMLAGVAEGMSLGFAQWLALRRAFPKLEAKAWLRASVLAAAGGWTVGALPSTIISLLGSFPASRSSAQAEPSTLWIVLGSALGGAVLGAAFGAMQWRALRAHAAHAERWVVSNAIGWGLALPWSYVAGSSAFAAESTLHAVTAVALAGLAMGSSVALADWFALRGMTQAALS